MAQLGMPSVIISFNEAGIAAIERSKRGIVALILEEEAGTISSLANPFTVYTTDDIPESLSEYLEKEKKYDPDYTYRNHTLTSLTNLPHSLHHYYFFLCATFKDFW